MRYFCHITGLSQDSGVPVVQFSGQAWDGASTLFGFSRQVSIGINDTDLDIQKGVIDDVAANYSAARKDVVLV